MNIQEKIKKLIQEALIDLNLNSFINAFNVEHPARLDFGDYSTNVAIRMGSVGHVEEIVKYLDEHKPSEIERVEEKAGFINFYLSKEFFAESLEEINKKGDKFGENDLFKNQKILVDHTQPNPFKEFHIGHLMNNAIGESICRILKANGAEVWAVGYHGDVGLHVAKTIWGKIQKPEFDWGMAYAYGSQNFEEHKEEITEINKKISDKSDKEINLLYEEGKKFSLDKFQKIYDQLDSKFDHHFYENETGEIGKEIVLENVGKIFEESEGAVVFRGENFEPKTHTRVFINSQSIPVYEAKEIGLMKLKKEKYDFDKSITITANEQDSFFDVVEVAITQIFPELKGKLLHLSHGILKLPTGKMSSRTGDVIKFELENPLFIADLRYRISEKLKDRGYSETENFEISETISIGAIKYSVLRQAIGGDIIFDFDKSISFEGDSGPYLQYSAVRANSVLQKSEIQNSKSETNSKFKIQKLENWETIELEKYLYRFPEIVERAGREYAPHHIVTYLTELASIFNSFYASNKIIDENDPSSLYKLALTQAAAHILKSGLRLLGIKVPERM